MLQSLPFNLTLVHDKLVHHQIYMLVHVTYLLSWEIKSCGSVSLFQADQLNEAQQEVHVSA